MWLSHPGVQARRVPQVHRPPRLAAPVRRGWTGPVQCRLRAGPGHGSAEREAERVAERLDEPGAALTVRQSSPRAEADDGGATDGLGPGQALDPGSKRFMEARFGQDFSHVRVHAGPAALAAADARRARAFTAGQDIVFGAGQYAPASEAGRQLLAHELTHVVQQTGRTGPAPVQHQEVGSDAQVAGKADWTTADRVGNTKRWQDACLFNLNAVATAQYKRIVERRDFYRWFYDYTASLGFSTRWALAARVVADGAHQIADMDQGHETSDSLFSLANVELQGAMREGNQVIFDNVMPKLKKLLDGGPLKGAAALKWDMQVLAEEQMLVQQMYKRLSPKTIDQLDYFARKKRLAWLGAKITGGDSVPQGPYNNKGTVPGFSGSDIRSVKDRWTYGMQLGDTFTPSGSGFDPARDTLPDVGADYKSDVEFKKVDVRPFLHELDAWLNPNRLDRVGPGSDYKAIIAGLTENDKKSVAQDRSPDGWAYSIAFAQFSFIDEATVTKALPTDAASAALVASFLARYRAERSRLQLKYPTPSISIGP